MSGKSLNQIIHQLLLVSYTYLAMQKEYDMHVFQSMTQRLKIK